MTTTSLANCLAFRTTEPIVAPSLYAGIAAPILDSTRARRRTGGAGVDASSIMLLSTHHWELDKEALVSLRAPTAKSPLSGFCQNFQNRDNVGSFEVLELCPWVWKR